MPCFSQYLQFIEVNHSGSIGKAFGIWLLNSILFDITLKGSVWETDKLILNDGRWFPETADVIFFSEKFVF